MAKVIWSDHALDDIEQISEYICKDSAERASLFVSRLIDAAEQMAAFPNSGRIIPEIEKDEYRETVYGSYRIMYKVVEHGIILLAVVHGVRDWKPK